MLKLYNTLKRKKENFKPIKKIVGLYTCGPTVYNYAHIGNLRTYVFEDILKRVLQFDDYKVKHVMNITDVGHLTDDADQGEDKMEKGAKRENKTSFEIAKFYEKAFFEDLKNLNIQFDPTKNKLDIKCRATDHIKEQINLVKTLIKKKYTYETSDGIYFDTTKLKDYGKLAGLKKQNLKAGVRVDLGEKKNPHDFALWKFSKPEEKRQMEWHAFGKMGFPGWHIECSAMATRYLGKQFDIHCGGIDHIPVHHTNEIAQSEVAFGKKPWVKYWMHGEFLLINEGKMAKSDNNFLTLQSLKDKHIDPLAYRYLLLQTHYRKQLNFSWEALKSAQNGLERLYKITLELKKSKVKSQKLVLSETNGSKINEQFLKLINDDLNLPEALALAWQGLKENKINYQTLLEFDKIFGLNLKNAKITETKIPNDVQKLLDLRQKAREEKNWTESDRLRDEIKKQGFDVEDTKDGQKIV